MKITSDLPDIDKTTLANKNPDLRDLLTRFIRWRSQASFSGPDVSIDDVINAFIEYSDTETLRFYHDYPLLKPTI